MAATLSPQEFVAKWKHVRLKEQAAAQQHFIDLCALVGHATPAEADPAGTWFTFEAGAAKAGGGQGRADVWKRGYFAWEYKGRHGDLERAYQQLQQYREALENPPLLVVSDIAEIRIHTNFTNTVKQIHRITLDDLLRPEGLELLRRVFYEPDSFRTTQTAEQVTQAAAGEFARLAQLLVRWGNDPQRTAKFLIRILFCLFAEDAGLLPRDLFRRMVESARRRPAAFRQQLAPLFQAMTAGGFFGADEVPSFDGGLFDDATVLNMDSDALDILARAAALDWSSIEPSIFGTLFERSLDPGKRSQLGAHYTGRDDILLIVEPVLMAPLRRQWEEVRARALALAEKRQAIQGAGRAQTTARQKLDREIFGLLRGFRNELAEVQVLDPAAGSGNFLYVALRLLLDLEKEVINLAAALGDTVAFPMVSPEQLHGIEINVYAHELAYTTIWIGYIQWLRENGFGKPAEPILKPIESIQLMDAVLAYDEEGRPIEPVWPSAKVIIGNPPFLGDKKMRAELGDLYVDRLRTLYAERIPGQSDLVCYWFEKARAMIESGRAKRAGLLATQGIRGGANRKVLERIKQSGDIFWAQSDRDWILDGATVHVAMVGFDAGVEPVRTLDMQRVDVINADLTAGIDLSGAHRLGSNSGIAYIGPSPHGCFDIPEQLAQQMLTAVGNPNRRPNSHVVRPVVSAVDIVQQPRRMWTIDFGLLTEEQAAEYEMPFEHIKSCVYPTRSRNRRAAYAEKWWQYAEARPGMRAALEGRRRYIATPRVSKHRIFVWLTTDVLANDGTVVFAREDDYFFGVLHSKPHELWSRRTGTQLREAESGFRYTPNTTFETFPFPWPPGEEPQDDPRVEAIAAAARELAEKRDAWLNPPGASEDELKKRTLTNLYNQRPAWLEMAHRRLDEAVLDAYGWEHGVGDEEILERLLKLNLERALR